MGRIQALRHLTSCNQKPTASLVSYSCPICITWFNHAEINLNWEKFYKVTLLQKRCLLLGRKVITNLDSILKSRDITLPTKVHPVKAMGFPGVMYGCESWTIKKAEHQRIDAFELSTEKSTEKTLESPLDCKIQPVHPEGNQSWMFTGRTDV